MELRGVGNDCLLFSFKIFEETVECLVFYFDDSEQYKITGSAIDLLVILPPGSITSLLHISPRVENKMTNNQDIAQ